MLLQIGEQAILENVLVGIKANNIGLPRDERELREGYQRYLKSVQPHCSWLRSDTHALIEDSVCEAGTHADLVKLFRGDATGLDDRNQTDVIREGMAPANHSTAVTSAIIAMKAQAPSHYNFLNTFVETIFYEGSEVATGGSTSTAVGAIWANPHPKFHTTDTLEFLIHELTHNLLFLDEWVHPHYDYDEILKPQTWCNSAILMTNRPLDKVVHSIIVATEIVLFRRELIGEPDDPRAHPPSKSLIEAVAESIRQIRALPGSKAFLKERVWFLLDNVEVRLIGSQPAHELQHA